MEYRTVHCIVCTLAQGPVLGRWFARLDKMVGSQQTLTGGFLR